MLKQILIPSTWQNNNPDWNEEIRHGVARFDLGLGPCGKTVTELDSDWTANGRVYVVKQTCSDGETKHFLYPLHTITGRITELSL